jgi:hypothetical protein
MPSPIKGLEIDETGGLIVPDKVEGRERPATSHIAQSGARTSGGMPVDATNPATTAAVDQEAGRVDPSIRDERLALLEARQRQKSV